jgi:hypothetical protein
MAIIECVDTVLDLVTLRYRGGPKYGGLVTRCREHITNLGCWELVEDDFDRWVREVREENGSDLCSL